MRDRVVDRSAAHAAPALLEVRDWLLVALSFSTGIYEAISFLTFGKIFMGFQTGNIVLLGVGIAGTGPPAGPDAVTAVVSLAAFAVGAMVAMRILPAFDGNEAVGDDEVFQVWERTVSIALGVALVLQAGFLAGWLTTSSPAHLAYLLVALGALAMGLQMNAIRALQVPGVSTTALPPPTSPSPAASPPGRSRSTRCGAWAGPSWPWPSGPFLEIGCSVTRMPTRRRCRSS
jgi:uncharacterized membrane protein YoaK (UPF0700 family)